MRFTGAVSDAEKKLIFAACDIHAMPSVQLGEMIEGFGIVFLEAAAAGKPSICGNIGGQAEAVLDGRTGLVVDGADLDRVADALRSLVRDRALRQRLGRAGAGLGPRARLERGGRQDPAGDSGQKWA